MTKPTVFFTDMRTTMNENMLVKLRKLIFKVGVDKIVAKKDLVAIKLHFGEKGNLSFLRPQYVREVVDAVKLLKGKPFLTDSNTLYVGQRADSVNHIACAIGNGFDFAVVDAPVIIADGLRGNSQRAMPVAGGELVKEAYLGSEVFEADALIVLTHFKGHEMSGFGGTIKNVGMGLASTQGKLAQHSTIAPVVRSKKCTGCLICGRWCLPEAIVFEGPEKIARILPEKCTGCGKCISVCPEECISIQWDAETGSMQKMMAEYTKAVADHFSGKVIYVSFIMDVSPACDCYGSNDTPIIPNIGILASTDPVALDTACHDLACQAPRLPATVISESHVHPEDPFRETYAQVDPLVQLRHGQKIGLGSMDYELVKI